MVHCETPTGVLNDLGPVLDLLADHGVLSIVDAVSSLGGTPVPTESIDVALGASQKCFSAPPGLTTASVSDDAWAAIEERDPRSLYTNLLPWRDLDGEFPYTHLVNNVAALDAALDRLLDEGLEAVYARHEAVADHCRERGREVGLEPYPDNARSAPTVTAFHVPGRASELQRRLAEDHDVVLAASYGDVADDVLRVGHMGYGAQAEWVDRAMDALAAEL
jgi:aspartate aminotransferase-like enzyme